MGGGGGGGMNTFGHDPRKQVKNCCQNHSKNVMGPLTEQREKTSSSNFCRENASLLFRSAMLLSAGEKLNSLQN